MSRGSRTRDQILRKALSQASALGLEGLSIGALARDLGMSKSGLFAHFGSKEVLQEQVLDLAAAMFTDNVVKPAIKAPRGEPRVRALFEGYLVWGRSAPIPGGCVFVSASFEFDDRFGPVRDRVVQHVGAVREIFARAARISLEEGHFRVDLDPEQFAFEVHAILLATQLDDRLFRSEDAEDRARSSFERLLATARS